MSPVIHSLHNLYLRSSNFNTLHMCTWMPLLLLQLHLCRERTENIKALPSTLVLTAETSRASLLPPEERRNSASQQNHIYPSLGEGHRLGRLKRPFSKNKQREIRPSVLILDEQMVFGIVIVTAEYRYLLFPPERECELQHLSTKRFCSWTGTVSCETLSCEPQPSVHNFLCLFEAFLTHVYKRNWQGEPSLEYLHHLLWLAITLNLPQRPNGVAHSHPRKPWSLAFERTHSDTYDGVGGQSLDSHHRALCFLRSLWLDDDMLSWRDSPETGQKLHGREQNGVQREPWWKTVCFSAEWRCEAVLCLTPLEPKLSCSPGLQDHMYSAFNWWTPSTFRHERKA